MLQWVRRVTRIILLNGLSVLSLPLGMKSGMSLASSNCGDNNYVRAQWYFVNDTKNVSVWIPDETFVSPDADVTAIFLAANDISYYEPVYDPIFFANGTFNLTTPDGSILYKPSFAFNIMVCLIQHQICNPLSGECAKLDGEANFQSRAYTLGLNPAQMATC